MSLTIAEAAERTGLTVHTLRYYERDGLMLDVDRSPTGHRRYADGDMEWIEMITRLRRTGMPIREVRRYAELVRAGEGTGPNDSRCSSSTVSASVPIWRRPLPTWIGSN